MIKDDKNLRDSTPNTLKDTTSNLAPYTGGVLQSASYIKTDKLITALFMVTDIIDQDEPLRHKLRTLGTEIISDVYALSVTPNLNSSIRAISKISETLSFLEIASTINLISPMNFGILKKEFLQLRKSIEDSVRRSNILDGQNSLSEFFKEEDSNHIDNQNVNKNPTIGQTKYSFPTPARLGVQKASTLMQAISDKTLSMSNKHSNSRTGDNFDVLKKDRRNEIISIIRSTSSMGATITDIKTKAKGSLASVGEKTLQRELVSMVKDNTLKKTGEKRWSRYFLAK